MTKIKGEVKRVTHTGILIDDIWYSKSKFNVVPGLDSVRVLDTIEAVIDDKKFILGLKILSSGL